MEPVNLEDFYTSNYTDTLDELRNRIVRAAGVPSNYLDGSRNNWRGEVQVDQMRQYSDLKKLYYNNHWKIDDIEFEVEKPKSLKAKRNKGGIVLETE